MSDYTPEQVEAKASYCESWVQPPALVAAKMLRAYAATLRQQAGSFDAVHSLPALWRQIEVSDESQTEFDKGYEQASRECADALQAALAQNTQGEAIGPLSSRLRPNVECAPWVIEAVKKLEAERATVPATDADIDAWAERHDLNFGGSATDARCAFEDAASLAAPSQPEDAGEVES